MISTLPTYRRFIKSASTLMREDQLRFLRQLIQSEIRCALIAKNNLSDSFKLERENDQHWETLINSFDYEVDEDDDEEE
ncbi:hypothetical protein KBZ15_16480 [Cyanobium sp. BA20m-p-22]|uniref:hypothetical protein n=1 Tax=Cyanobium sp. BA20m-p-22 TaxID=2823704 RepID=UPI0020CC183C|nr:hypothetical protein [Cyanobium sp. BA20m-p-22]MCP9911488.1 hypothetical protein [Cyanobium sp. BA20m-p-22]